METVNTANKTFVLKDGKFTIISWSGTKCVCEVELSLDDLKILAGMAKKAGK